MALDALVASAPSAGAVASVFDVLLVNRFGATLSGGCEYVVSILLRGTPLLAVHLSPWKEELVALLALHLQSQALVGRGATVEELLYGWTRRPAFFDQSPGVGSAGLQRAIRHMVAASLFGAVAVPYVHRKLRTWGSHQSANGPAVLLARGIPSSLDLVQAAYMLAFALGGTRWSSPWLHFAGAQLERSDLSRPLPPPAPGKGVSSGLSDAVHSFVERSTRAAPRIRAAVLGLIVAAHVWDWVAERRRRGALSGPAGGATAAEGADAAPAAAAVAASPWTTIPPPPLASPPFDGLISAVPPSAPSSPSLPRGLGSGVDCNFAGSSSSVGETRQINSSRPFVCTICGDPPTRPCAVPTGYVFCMVCLLRHIRARRSRASPSAAATTNAVSPAAARAVEEIIPDGLALCPATGALFRVDALRPLYTGTTASAAVYGSGAGSDAALFDSRV